MRITLAFGLLCCFTLGFLPLGCGGVDESAQVQQPVMAEGLKLPEKTLASLQACADEYAPRLPSSKYELSVTVEVSSSGQVVKMTKSQAKPYNQGVGSCTMLALEAMEIPVSELRKRSAPGVSKNTQSAAGRGQIGFAIPIALGVAEVLIVSGAVTFIFTIAVSLVGSIADTLDDYLEVKRKCEEQYMDCLESATADKKGGLHKHTLCYSCRDACIGERGKWPEEVEVNGKPQKCAY
jgi:hypothetical protein